MQIGRTSHCGNGDHDAVCHSIRKRLALDQSDQLIPGKGSRTFHSERTSNAFADAVVIRALKVNKEDW